MINSCVHTVNRGPPNTGVPAIVDRRSNPAVLVDTVKLECVQSRNHNNFMKTKKLLRKEGKEMKKGLLILMALLLVGTVAVFAGGGSEVAP